MNNFIMMDISSGIQNIVAGQGIKIAISGMLIVFAALAVISFFIYYLPFILEMLAPILPSKENSHGSTSPSSAPEDEIIAAIGFVLHKETGTLAPSTSK